MIETKPAAASQSVPVTDLPKVGDPGSPLNGARSSTSTPAKSGRQYFLVGASIVVVVVLAAIVLCAGSWLQALIAVIPISLILYVAISQILARFVRPVEDLVAESQRVAAAIQRGAAAGDISRSISLSDEWEVGRVASSVNQIVRQLRESSDRAAELDKSLRAAQVSLSASDELQLSYDNLLVVSGLGQQIIASLKLDDVAMKVYETLNTMMDAAALELGSLERAPGSLGGGAVDDRSSTDDPGSVKGAGPSATDHLHIMLSIDNQVVHDPYHIPLSEQNNFAAWTISHGREVFLDDVENNYTRYIRQLETDPSVPRDGRSGPRSGREMDDRSSSVGPTPFTWEPGSSNRVKSLMVVPMFSKGSAIGVIAVGSYRRHAFSQYHLDMVKSLALYVAVALDNASAYQKLDRALTELTLAQRQLVQSEKMSSLGLLTAGIAHEINNPINFVSANVNPLRRNLVEVREILESYRALQTAKDVSAALARLKDREKELNLDYTVGEITELLNGIEEGAKRTAEIVQGLRNFARTDENALKFANIHQGLDSTLTLLANKYRNRIEIVKEYAELPDVECYPGQLNQVFMNVLSNAVQAIEGPGTITIRTARGPKEGEPRMGQNNLEIRILDTGTGMPEEVRKHIFDPFYTTKDVGVGTGLGLSISYGIVEKHGGTIEVESEPGHGSEFIIRLPLTHTKQP